MRADHPRRRWREGNWPVYFAQTPVSMGPNSRQKRNLQGIHCRKSVFVRPVALSQRKNSEIIAADFRIIKRMRHEQVLMRLPQAAPVAPPNASSASYRYHQFPKPGGDTGGHRRRSPQLSMARCLVSRGCELCLNQRSPLASRRIGADHHPIGSRPP